MKALRLLTILAVFLTLTACKTHRVVGQEHTYTHATTTQDNLNHTETLQDRLRHTKENSNLRIVRQRDVVRIIDSTTIDKQGDSTIIYKVHKEYHDNNVNDSAIQTLRDSINHQSALKDSTNHQSVQTGSMQNNTKVITEQRQPVHKNNWLSIALVLGAIAAWWFLIRKQK